MIRNGLQFKLFGSGCIATAEFALGELANPAVPPSREACCGPVLFLNEGRQRQIEDGPGVSIQFVLLKPRSRGEVRRASSSPEDKSEFSANFLGNWREIDAKIDAPQFFRRTLKIGPLFFSLPERTHVAAV